jgi:hypothetical protein
MFKIQPNPTFSASVTITSHAEEQVLNLTFKAKTAKDYQGLLDVVGKAKGEAISGAMADTFLALVESWDADMELSKASVLALNDHRPGAVWRIIEAYGEQMIAARKGN